MQSPENAKRLIDSIEEIEAGNGEERELME